MLTQILLLFTTLMICSDAYKVLVAFPMPSKSHGILGDGIVRALSKAGHEVTFITPFPKNKVELNVREIDVSANKEVFPDNISNIKQFLEKKRPGIGHIANIITSFSRMNARTLEIDSVQKLINDPKEQFDVVILEWMFHEVHAGLAAVFNCPLIWVSSTQPHWKILQLVDEAANPALIADILSTSIPPFTFFERTKELAIQVGGKALSYFLIDPMQNSDYERLLAPVIRQRGYEVPSFDEVRYNGSLVLSNSHVSYGKANPLPQNFIPIGGYHIDRNLKPLPENLQKILDNAKHGVIYFSMGSNLKSKFLPEELKQSLLKMFGALKYSVIWKFEEELPGTPSNVHIVQWAPQHSILAHPNCVLFMTHGGLLSMTEVIHFGKPIIAIPVFADQFINAKTAVEKGFGIKVEFSYTMAKDIKLAIEEIFKDATFSKRAKDLSEIYHDRPMTPDKELVHWVEHVVKTRGAPHLRSPALRVPCYQKLYLDLAAVLATILIGIVYAIKKVISYFSKNKTNLKKHNN